MAAVNIDDAIRRYFSRIHRAALILTGSPWDADDLTQETFLLFSQNRGKFKGNSSLYTYLYGILLNLERRHRRRYGMWRRKLRVLCEDESWSPRAAPPADASLEVAEWKRSLWARVAELPDGQRQVLVLRFSEGLRYEEIAEALEIPLGTVKSRIYHGLLALRRQLSTQETEFKRPPLFPHEDVSDAV
jgi:RNA polymerase sigma-70 factor (ECF subfamily)